MPAQKGVTPPTQFRLSDETLAQIDELAAALTIPSRVGVVRLAVARMHRQEISGISGPTGAGNAASPKKSSGSKRRKKSA